MKTLLKKTILIAEDDEGILDALSQLLEGMNYEVIQVSDGFKIIDQVKQTLPDLVLLDITFPGVDGCEVSRQIKKNKLLRHVAVILMSANNNREFVKEANADDFIAKPFDVFELIRKIKKHLEKTSVSLVRGTSK